jgi:Zn-dependent protease
MPAFLHPSYIIAILIALSVHEWAHAFVASRLGDPTGKYEGRLTLNPVAHIDPLGALLFLTVGFGWGKPVPVNPRYFKNIRRDTALVSLAGPFSNLVVAFIAFFGLKLLAPHVDGTSGQGLLQFSASAGGGMGFLMSILADSLFLNLGLMAFNLLPIAPLDGSKVLGSLIPLRYEDDYDRFMQYGPYLLLALLIMERAVNFPLLETWIYGIIDPILRVMMAMV